ncbi:uncharacterized protein VP01_10925g1, partial [Puccinia sorghi]
PQPFNGARGATAESFVGQILLHTMTHPDQFPTNSSKVAFSGLFMTDYAATCCPTIPLPNWNSVGLHAGVQLTRSHLLMGQNPTDDSLPAWTEGKRPNHRGSSPPSQLNLSFHCGQARHVSHGCSNRSRKLQGCQQSLSSAPISELQAKINRIRTNTSTTNPAPTPENASLSKNGGAQV